MARMMHLTVLTLAMTAPLAMTHAQQESCGYDWTCWEMFPYAEVPVWTNDDVGTPGAYDSDVPSPLMIYPRVGVLPRTFEEAETRAMHRSGAF